MFDVGLWSNDVGSRDGDGNRPQGFGGNNDEMAGVKGGRPKSK